MSILIHLENRFPLTPVLDGKLNRWLIKCPNAIQILVLFHVCACLHKQTVWILSDFIAAGAKCRVMTIKKTT